MLNLTFWHRGPTDPVSVSLPGPVLHILFYLSPAWEPMFLTKAYLSDNSCGTGNHGAQPDKTLKHRTPFTEYVPQIMPRWDTGILTYGDRGSFVLFELNKTRSWCNSLNITFKTCQWGRKQVIPAIPPSQHPLKISEKTHRNRR